MKERILFECVGQAGGNIGELLAEKGYLCHFINSSDYDLTALEKVKDGFKFHIPNAFGCNKDRRKALNYAKDYYKYITDLINSRFPRQDIVYFVFSLGGGTGSGISPAILDYMASNNPNKNYGAICVFPSNSEPMKTQINAIEAYNEIISIENLKSVFFLDNNSMDKFELNKEFVELFDQLVNITNPDPRGIIDPAELETLLVTKGVTVISKLDFPYTIYPDKLKEGLTEASVFAPFKLNSCKYLGVSMAEDFETEMLERVFGIPEDVFIGYNDTVNFIVATGLPLYSERANILARRVKARQFDKSNPQNEIKEVAVEVPKLAEKKETPPASGKKSFDDVFGNFMK